jgi:WD40 repeat protein
MCRELVAAVGGFELADESVHGSIVVWDLQEEMVPPLVLMGHNNYVQAAYISPGGAFMYTCCLDGKVRQTVFVVESHCYIMNTITLYGFAVTQVMVWDLRVQPTPTGRCLPDAHKKAVYGVSLSHNSKMLATSGADGVVLWDVCEDQHVIRQWFLSEAHHYHGGGSGCSFSPDDSQLVVAARNSMCAYVIDIATGRLKLQLDGGREPVWAAESFAWQGKTWAVTGSHGGCIDVWPLDECGLPKVSICPTYGEECMTLFQRLVCVQPGPQCIHTC